MAIKPDINYEVFNEKYFEDITAHALMKQSSPTLFGGIPLSGEHRPLTDPTALKEAIKRSLQVLSQVERKEPSLEQEQPEKKAGLLQRILNRKLR